MESAEQIQGIMARGFEQRAVGCHDVNAHSSRSHCLLVVRVAATDPATGAPPARAPEAGLQVSTPSVRPTWEEKHISKQASSPRCSVRPGPASACAPPHSSLAGASSDPEARTGPVSGSGALARWWLSRGACVLPAGVRAVGKLTLCDLAGSERITKTGATGAHRAALAGRKPAPLAWLP